MGAGGWDAYLGYALDWAVESPLNVGELVLRDTGVRLQPLEQVVLDVCDLEQLGDLVVQQLLLLAADTNGVNTGVALGAAEQRDAVLETNVQIRLCQSRLHLGGFEEAAAVGVEAAEELGMLIIRLGQPLQVRDDVRGVDGQDSVCPVLLDVPLVEVEVEDFVARVVDDGVSFHPLRCCEGRPTVHQLWLPGKCNLEPVQDLVDQGVAKPPLVECLFPGVVGRLAVIDP